MNLNSSDSLDPKSLQLFKEERRQQIADFIQNNKRVVPLRGKKSQNNLQSPARPKVKYQFIEQQHSEFAVRVLWEMLKVSESGFYAWRKRQPSYRQKEDEELTSELETVFEQSRQTYGSPRINAALRSKGVSCSRRRNAYLCVKRNWCRAGGVRNAR
jgi:hypothetical protein